MQTGEIKFWNVDKGFGFITPEGGGPDIYVVQTGVMSSIPPRKGQRVSFELKEDRRAANVRIL